VEPFAGAAFVVLAFDVLTRLVACFVVVTLIALLALGAFDLPGAALSGVFTVARAGGATGSTMAGAQAGAENRGAGPAGAAGAAVALVASGAPAGTSAGSGYETVVGCVTVVAAAATATAETDSTARKTASRVETVRRVRVENSMAGASAQASPRSTARSSSRP